MKPQIMSARDRLYNAYHPHRDTTPAEVQAEVAAAQQALVDSTFSIDEAQRIDNEVRAEVQHERDVRDAWSNLTDAVTRAQAAIADAETHLGAYCDAIDEGTLPERDYNGMVSALTMARVGMLAVGALTAVDNVPGRSA